MAALKSALADGVRRTFDGSRAVVAGLEATAPTGTIQEPAARRKARKPATAIGWPISHAGVRFQYQRRAGRAGGRKIHSLRSVNGPRPGHVARRRRVSWRQCEGEGFCQPSQSGPPCGRWEDATSAAPRPNRRCAGIALPQDAASDSRRSDRAVACRARTSFSATCQRSDSPNWRVDEVPRVGRSPSDTPSRARGVAGEARPHHRYQARVFIA